MSLRLRLLPPAEWPAWAGFVQMHNQRADGRVRCLHAEQGADTAALAAELAGLAPGRAVFVAAEQEGAPIGWIGAELDAIAGRAWLRGPLGAVPAAWPPLVDALLQALPATTRCDAFPQADEAGLVAAYEAAGFGALATHRVLRATQAPAMPPAAPIVAVAPGAAVMPDLLALHDRLFPDTYLRGDALPASMDAQHRLFAALPGGRLAGYVYVQHKPAEPEGYVDYLGVAESARGQGLGRALLATALRWALLDQQLPCVHLTVRQHNAAALALYRSVGFVEVAAGLQLSRAAPGRGDTVTA